MKRPFTDTWPEPLTEGQKLMRSYGETPESMRHHDLRDQAARIKRERRIDRNVANEARQGRYNAAPHLLVKLFNSGAPLLELVDEEEVEEAKCRCGKRGEVNYDDGNYRGYFCGGSDRCIP
jgi:hypothetical protein